MTGRLFLVSTALAIVLLGTVEGLPRPAPGIWLVLRNIAEAVGTVSAAVAVLLLLDAHPRRRDPP